MDCLPTAAVASDTVYQRVTYMDSGWHKSEGPVDSMAGASTYSPASSPVHLKADPTLTTSASYSPHGPHGPHGSAYKQAMYAPYQQVSGWASAMALAVSPEHGSGRFGGHAQPAQPAPHPWPHHAHPHHAQGGAGGAGGMHPGYEPSESPTSQAGLYANGVSATYASASTWSSASPQPAEAYAFQPSPGLSASNPCGSGGLASAGGCGGPMGPYAQYPGEAWALPDDVYEAGEYLTGRTPAPWLARATARPLAGLLALPHTGCLLRSPQPMAWR